jgi:hypothetical protein
MYMSISKYFINILADSLIAKLKKPEIQCVKAYGVIIGSKT